MEVTVGLFVGLVVLAFFCEYIDASFGMGYGTILSPVLLIMGFSPLVAVPAILLSQAVGGFAAATFHHQFQNVSFRPESRDFKIVFIISSFGIVATIFAAIVAINIPQIVLKAYIGILVLAMGILILINKQFTFSWGKMVGVGILSAFNKGLSGGGFGPVVTAGQIMAGHNHRGAIGVTTLAEAPICTVSFLTYLVGRAVMELNGSVMQVPLKDFLVKMFSPKMFQWELLLALVLGSLLVAPFGALTTQKIPEKAMHWIVGSLITVLGIWSLYKIFS